MPDYSGVTWRVNYGEIAERDQFRVGYVGQQSFDAYFELGQLSDLIGVLTTVQGMSIGQISRGDSVQARKVSVGPALTTVVLIEPRQDTFPPKIMSLDFVTLSDFLYALTLFQSAVSGETPDDWAFRDPSPAFTALKKEVDELKSALVGASGKLIHRFGAAWQSSTLVDGWDTNAHERIPFRLPRRPTKWRVGVGATNTLTGVTHTPNVTITGVFVGEHSLPPGSSGTGQFAAAPVSAGGGSLVSGQFLTPWNTAPLPDAELPVSVGWMGAAGQANVLTSAGGWTSAGTGGDSSHAGDIAPTLQDPTAAAGIYWDIWVEYEYAVTAGQPAPKIVAVVASSLGTNFQLSGAASSEMIAWPQRLATMSGHAVVNLSVAGAVPETFISNAGKALDRIQGLVPDEVILMPLSNSFAAGVTASNAGVLMVQLLTAIKQRWPHALLTEITEPGRADYTSGQNTERHVWNNAILNTTRIIGIDRVMDADTLLSTGDVLTAWANVGDGIHFSSRAHNVLAASY